MYAEWGIDFVKVDDIAREDCGPEAPGAAFSEIAMIRKAIENSGRSIVLSLSPGPARVDQKDFLLNLVGILVFINKRILEMGGITMANFFMLLEE